MPLINPGTGQIATPNKQRTVAQIFDQRKLVMWWNNPTQFYNGKGEKGTDYGLGGFNDVGSIMSGTVVYADHPPEWYIQGNSGYSSIGYIVQILSDDGQTLTHYQHLRSISVKVGQQVGVAFPIGNAGGCQEGYYGSSACLATGRADGAQDAWSTGEHIEVRLSHRYHPNARDVWSAGDWVDPYATFLAWANQTPQGVIASSSLPTGASANLAGKIIQNAHNPLKVSENVSDVLIYIDGLLSIYNPFDLSYEAAFVRPGSINYNLEHPQNTSSVIPGVDQLNNLISTTFHVFDNIVGDFGAITFRAILLIVGIAFLIKSPTFIGSAARGTASGTINLSGKLLMLGAGV